MINFYILKNNFFFNNNFLNIKNYSIFINLFNKNFYILNNFFILKYNWSDIYYFDDEINLHYIKPLDKNTFKYFIKENSFLIKKDYLNDKIIFKKKCSVLKKKFNINYIVLNKVFSYRNNFDKNLFINNLKNEKYLYTNKFIDLKKNIKLLLKNNREIVKLFFNKKYYRNFSLSKNLKNFCNNNKSFIFLLENNIINILMKTNFFMSKNDCVWFIKNKMVSVNSNILLNCEFILKTNDIINISNSSYYYYFYKNNLNFLLNNLYKINFKLWSVNRNNLNFLKSFSFKENYSKLIENYKYFYLDIPIYLEIDYISMTIFVLNNNLNYKFLDFYNTKYFSFYMNRSYNWKFIV